MMLRDYQQAAGDAAIASLRKSVDPIVITAATGAGKSHIIAALADELHKRSNGKRVLCIAPSKELVLQNYAKFAAAGGRASIFSASAGEKSLRHPVTFGSPISVLNSIDQFSEIFCAVIVDEAHGLTPTLIKIIDALQDKNPLLRVIGLTATPYRMGTGYIYKRAVNNVLLGDELTKDPYFSRCVYDIGAKELIARKYLTPPTVEDTTEAYDTSGLSMTRAGKWDQSTVDVAFEGKGRLTASIIAEIVELCQQREGVLIFASTISHARECLASLPPELSAIVTGKTPQKERAEILERFLCRKIKYLCNVSVLTTGFDAPHVDAIALLRATESAALLQQIVGRGLRICEGKKDCLVLDYAGNINRHCPSGDIFEPVIETSGARKASPIEIVCPECFNANLFTQKPPPPGQKGEADVHGYIWRHGEKVIDPETGKQAINHNGRRCMHEDMEGNRCEHRWQYKLCKDGTCKAKNDITARACSVCGGELIDPNKKLVDRLKDIEVDKAIMTERVLDITESEFTSRAGNPCHRIAIRTERRVITDYHQADMPHGSWQRRAYDKFLTAKEAGINEVTFKRKPNTRYFKVLGYNN